MLINIATSRTVGSVGRPRFLPGRLFPAYAYLPGKGPHPVRDPSGHSYRAQPIRGVASLDSEEFAWGQDLFNHGYYWEAHEAWEGLWHVSDRGSPLRAVLKALILLSASGVKIREGKRAPAMRHAGRAGGLLRQLTTASHDQFACTLGMLPARLAELAEAAADTMPALRKSARGEPEQVFEFFLGNPRSFSGERHQAAK